MKFGIIGNVNKQGIGNILSELLDFLRQEDIDFAIDKDLSAKIKTAKYKKYCSTFGNVMKNSDIIVSLGGDGTFLYTARLVGKREIPILGVNMGTLGFMAEVIPSGMKSFIKQILKGKYKISERVILSSRLPGGRVMDGINDIVIDRERSIRLLEIEVLYNDEHVVKFVGDGVIISTPTGSTGYSLSAGGPVVSLQSKVFIITPICAHTLNVRPIIVPDDGIIMVNTNRDINVRITVDGQEEKIVKSPAGITLSKGNYVTKVLHRNKSSYFKTLNKKLFWGEDIRKY